MFVKLYIAILINIRKFSVKINIPWLLECHVNPFATGSLDAWQLLQNSATSVQFLFHTFRFLHFENIFRYTFINRKYLYLKENTFVSLIELRACVISTQTIIDYYIDWRSWFHHPCRQSKLVAYNSTNQQYFFFPLDLSKPICSFFTRSDLHCFS